MARKKSRVINTILAGASQSNPDGTERQDLIKDLIMGEMVLLVRDRRNEHDLYATQVRTQSGETIGWVPRQKTPQVGAWIDAGNLAVANVTSRGTVPGKEIVGVNIDIALVSEEDRPQVEADIRNCERWRRKELERFQAPRPDPMPKFQVTEGNDFPVSMIFLGIGLFLFMACGYTVCVG